MNIYSVLLLAKTDHMHMITILTELAIKNVHMHVVLNEVCHLEVQIAVKLKAYASSKISYIIIINEKLILENMLHAAYLNKCRYTR